MKTESRTWCALLAFAVCSMTALSATFTVTNSADSGLGTLRQAVEDAHANGSAPDTITFNIGGTPPITITLQTSLRSLSFPNYEIRADTQPGYAAGVPAIYLVPAAGSGAQTQPVFASSTSNCVIRGFHISGFTNVAAVSFGGYGFNTVAANILVHNGDGVYVSGGISNLIGGFSAVDRNVISSNTDIGVRFEGGTNNTVAGNFIGTDTNGLLSWPNRLSGITLNNTLSNTVRGTASAPQVLSGNGSAGISMSASAQGNVVAGNYIGTDRTGTNQLRNGISGITMDGSPRNTIGGTNAADRNVISGNGEYGLHIAGGATGNSILNNLIGLASNGVSVISNAFDGVRLYHAPSNTVGANGRGNYICGNRGSGIQIEGTGSVGNALLGNYIGLGLTSNAAPNQNPGIYLWDARETRIGGTTAGDGNVVGYHATDGILIRGSNAIANLVLRNYVGVDPAGTARPNTGNGVRIDAARSNQVGATLGSGRNIISGNGSAGLYIHNGAAGTKVYGNYIGLNPAGTAAVSNNGTGIYVSESTGTVIGLLIGGNAISGNGSVGIYVNSNSPFTSVFGNYIGTSAAGTNGVPNGSDGVYCLAPNAQIGGTFAGEQNLVAGNAGTGIALGPGAHDAVVVGNILGLDYLGRYAVSNGQYGIVVRNSQRVRIGNGTPAGRNVIAGSRLTGLKIEGACSNAVVAGNYIGTGAAGTNAVGNNSGVEVASDYVLVGGTNAADRNVIGGSGIEGVLVSSGRFVAVRGNYIGVGADGTTPLPNYYGVRVQGPAAGVEVGGADTGSRNVVARNIGHEVWIEGPSSGNNVVSNYLGLDSSGAAYVGLSGGSLVRLDHAPGNTIRGNAMGSSMEGIEIFGTGSFANVVAENDIGTDATATEPAAIFNFAVHLMNASSNRIGGSAADMNVIANSRGGILVTNTAGHSALRNVLGPNLVFSNAPGLNIDLGGDGPTSNDAGDVDTGPNGLQNRPTLTNAFVAAPFVFAQGVLTSAPSTTYAIDLFRADGTNAGSRLYLGRVPVVTDAGGVGTFSAGFPLNLAPGTYLAALATDPAGDTSEFAVSPAGLAAAGGDADNDLMPDYWENQYGLDPNASNGPTADADADGYTDLAEYIADTAANDSNAFPYVSAISNAGPRHVTFPSSGARVYSLYYNDALGSSPAWLQSGSSVTGQYGNTTIADASNVMTRAYRLSVKLP